MDYLNIKDEIVRMQIFEEIEELPKYYKKYLSPDRLLENRKITIEKRAKIDGWEAFEYGHSEWDVKEFKAILMSVADEILQNDPMLILVTDEALSEGTMIKLHFNELEALDDIYLERYQIVFMEPQDYIVFLDQCNYIIIVHHSGYVFLCSIQQ